MVDCIVIMSLDCSTGVSGPNCRVEEMKNREGKVKGTLAASVAAAATPGTCAFSGVEGGARAAELLVSRQIFTPGGQRAPRNANRISH